MLEAGHPPLSVLVRGGDEPGAVALVLRHGEGLVAHTALSALIEARLRAQGLLAQGQGDRDTARITVLVRGADETSRALRGVVLAAAQPLEPKETAALRLVAARVRVLRIGALTDPRLEALAACTGEAALPHGASLPGMEGPEGIERLEAWRSAAGPAQASLGAVGGPEEMQAARAALSSLPPWKGGLLPPPLVVSPGGLLVHDDHEARRGEITLSVAAWYGHPDTAPDVALRLGHPSAPLAGRLRALDDRLQVQRIAGVSRPGGSCLLVRVRGAQRERGSEQEIAQIVEVVRREIEASRASAQPLPLPEDPREAASAGAWRALTRPPSPPPTSEPRWQLAVGLHSPSSRQGPDAARIEAVLQELERQRGAPLESQLRVESGRGRVWMLLANRCPQEEAPGERGISGLALLAALRGRASEGVALEPWLSPGGAGVLAWTEARAGENAVATGQRLGEAVGRAFLGEPPGSGAIQEARGALLARLSEQGSFPEQLWASLGTHPERFWVSGTLDGVARPGVEAVQQRWARIARGPLRAAVLADSPEQGAAALARVQRWLLPSVSGGSCRNAEQGPPQAGGAILNEKHQAFLAWRVDGSGVGEAMAWVSALWLGEGGGLARGLEGSPVQGSSFVVGEGREMALVVALQGPGGELPGAIERAQAVMERLAEQGEDGFWARAVERWGSQERERRLSPRGRLEDLWSGRERKGGVEPGAWREWVRAQLTAGRAVVLRPKPE